MLTTKEIDDLSPLALLRSGASTNSSVALSADENLALVQYIDHLRITKAAGIDQDPELYRRERPSVPTTPVNTPITDYATAGLYVQRAMHHLDEALPTGQRTRAELAMHMLRRGTEELAVWMRARGYTV